MQSTTCSKILGLLFAASSLRAETVITEAEFLAAVDDTHPAAIALRAPLGRARADRAKAAILENPRLLFDREELEEAPRETTWGLAWSPPLDGRYGLGIDAAEEGLEAAAIRLAADLMTLRKETRRVFASWLLAESRHSLLARHHERLRVLAARMAKRAEMGEESRLDARRIELAATTAAAKLAIAEADLVQAGKAAHLWNPGLPGDARAVLEDLPEIPQGLEAWNRPDLLAKNSVLEKARIEDRLSRRFWSFPEVRMGWKTLRGADLDLDGPVFAFDWRFPLFDRRQADRMRVTEELGAAEADLIWSNQRATVELEVALRRYQALWLALRETRDIASRSDEVLQMGGAAFAQGEHTTTDLLEIWGAVVTTQMAVLDLEFEALAAHREIEVAAGRALPLGGTS